MKGFETLLKGLARRQYLELCFSTNNLKRILVAIVVVVVVLNPRAQDRQVCLCRGGCFGILVRGNGVDVVVCRCFGLCHFDFSLQKSLSSESAGLLETEERR